MTAASTGVALVVARQLTSHRPIHITDHFGFTAGALGEKAFALSAPARIPTIDDDVKSQA